jgi:hypothetical protein
MSEELSIRSLDEKDRAYALSSWRESHRESSKFRRVPWSFYKHVYGKHFEKLIREAYVLGAYLDAELLGFLVMSRSKRVNTLHWVQTKFQDKDGIKLRRRGVMTELLKAADLGQRFAYTLRARKNKGVFLDELLAKKLLETEVVATYIPLLEWIK